MLDDLSTLIAVLDVLRAWVKQPRAGFVTMPGDPDHTNEMCIFCGTWYDYMDEYQHYDDDCLILKLRQALKAADDA